MKHIRGILVEEEEINIEDTTEDADTDQFELEKPSVSKVVKGKKTPKIIKKPSKPVQIAKNIAIPMEKPANVVASQSNDNNNSDDEVEWIPPRDVETICIDEDNDTKKGTTEKNENKNVSAVLEKNGR